MKSNQIQSVNSNRLFFRERYQIGATFLQYVMVFLNINFHDYNDSKHDIYPGSHSLYISYYGDAGVEMNKFQDKVATEKTIRHTDASSRSNIVQHVQNPAKSRGSQR